MTAKTKDLIRDTLLVLARERPVSKITVKDIVERCGINRNTFYYHFRDIPDVVDYALSSMVGVLAPEWSRQGSMSAFFLSFLRYLAANQKAVLHIYKSLKRESFVKYMRLLFSYLEDPMREAAPELSGLNAKEQELTMFFCTCVMEGVLLEWMESGMDGEILAKAEQISQFLSSDPAKILDLLYHQST